MYNNHQKIHEAVDVYSTFKEEMVEWAPAIHLMLGVLAHAIDQPDVAKAHIEAALQVTYGMGRDDRLD